MKAEKYTIIGKDQIQWNKYLITEIDNVIYVFFRNLKMEENTVTRINNNINFCIQINILSLAKCMSCRCIWTDLKGTALGLGLG